jgi:hypothetical protein
MITMTPASVKPFSFILRREAPKDLAPEAAAVRSRTRQYVPDPSLRSG